MNDNYYQNPTFPGTQLPPSSYNQQTVPSVQSSPTEMYPYTPSASNTENYYIENILKINKGKISKLYFSYPDSIEWRNKVFDGVIEQTGRDYVIISDPKTGNWYILPLLYFNYAIFEEPINYKEGINK